MKRKTIVILLIFIIVVVIVGAIISNIDSIKDALGMDDGSEKEAEKTSKNETSLIGNFDEKSEGYESLINTYLSAYSEFDTEVLIEIIDFKAYDWDLDISTFEETYNSVSDEGAENYKEEFKESLSSYESYYEYYEYEDLLQLVSIDSIESTDVTGLAKVKSSIKETVTYNEENQIYDSQVYFYIYNGKIVAMDSIDDESNESDSNTSNTIDE